jgi:hypothetical protein
MVVVAVLVPPRGQKEESLRGSNGLRSEVGGLKAWNKRS